MIGLISGIGSMVCFAFLSVYTRHLLRRFNIWTMTVYSFIFASLFWLVVNPPGMIASQSPSGATWGGLVVLAVISVLIPHSLFFAGMQYVVASRAIITSTLEPIVAMTSAAIVLGELLRPVQVIGAAFVVCAIVLLQMRREGEDIVGQAGKINAA